MSHRWLLETATQPVQDALKKIGVESVPFFFPLLDRFGPPFFGLFIFIMEMVPLVPCGPFALTAGVLYGSYTGFVTAALAQECSALGAFLLGRFVLKRMVAYAKPEAKAKIGGGRNLCCKPSQSGNLWRLQSRLVYILDGLDKASYRKQFLTFILLRQSPLIPFSLCNYTVGALTRLPVLPFALGTIIGCIPGNVVWVSLGAAARAGQQLSGALQTDAPHDSDARMFVRV